MNKVRRKEISGIIEQLSALRDQIEQLQEEEQEAFDNLPEGVQLSDGGVSWNPRKFRRKTSDARFPATFSIRYGFTYMFYP